MDNSSSSYNRRRSYMFFWNTVYYIVLFISVPLELSLI